jgi:hypothetical protein
MKPPGGRFQADRRRRRRWSGADPPGVVYGYAPGRGAEHAEKMLKGFSGVLQVDGYVAYKIVAAGRGGNNPLRLAHCWSHGRRKLREVFDRFGGPTVHRTVDSSASPSPIAEEGLRRIADLYRIEADIKGQCDAARRAARQERSRPLVEAFGDWLSGVRAKTSAKSRLGEKLAYFANHWEGLCSFLDDGRVEMDTNAVENCIRPVTLNRKNALFAGHDEGGVAWGRIASLIETCKLNGVEPFACLRATLEAIAAGHPQSRIEDLLPWAFKHADG